MRRRRLDLLFFDFQANVIAVDGSNFGVMIGHEAAEFFHGHFDGHGGNKFFFQQFFIGIGLAPPRFCFAVLIFYGRTCANCTTQFLPLALAMQQCPIGAAEHGFGRVAGLNFGNAETGRDLPGSHF